MIGKTTENPQAGKSEFELALEAYAPVSNVQIGTVLPARVVSETKHGFFVDIQAKHEAFLPFKWVSESASLDEIKEVIVVQVSEESGEVLVSQKHLSVGDANITEVIEKGGKFVGLTAVMYGLQTFLPVSELAANLSRLEVNYILGLTLPVKVLHTGKKSGRYLVVSNRTAIAERREEILKSLKPGALHSATVTAIPKINTGVVVAITLQNESDIDEPQTVTGFIRRSEVVEQGDRLCSDVLHIGEEIDVEVTAVDFATGKVFLAYRSLVSARFIASAKVGDIVEAEVSENVEFGTFVRLATCVKALLHKSHQLRVNGSIQTLARGQKIQVRIIELDKARMRISVSTKGIPAGSVKSDPQV